MLERFIADFHFLRPWWLAALISALLIYLALRRGEDERRRWQGVIAPHLLDSLLTSAKRRARVRPLHLAALTMAIVAIGAAGPSWEREPTPFTEDTSPLVIALSLSQAMDAIDVQPTRLERVKQKIRDLLALRQGARTGLVVYAGTAHLVVPLTEDRELFEIFLSSLETGLMPEPGRDLTAAVERIEPILAKEDAPGTVLVIADGIDESDFAVIERIEAEGRDQVLALAVGTEDGGPVKVGDGRYATRPGGGRLIATLDVASFQSLRRRTGAGVTSLTVDGEDVEWIQRRVQSHLIAAQTDDPDARWTDFGYYFTIPAVLFVAMWFRKGWTTRWAALAFCSNMLLPAPSQAQEFRWADLFFTADQQGRYAFEQGDYARAAERFEDSYWKGIALYHAEDYAAAIDQFARLETAEAYFYQANAFARTDDLEAAIASYEEALKRQPEFPQATTNLELVRSWILPEEDDDEEAAGDPTFEADEVKFDEKGKKGKKGQIEQELFSEEQLAELWMRNIQTTPAEFLRRKFLIQSERAKNVGSGP